MKKLNITKEAFEKSNYFKNKYGELEYVSESGKVFKTNKGKILMFKESCDDEFNRYYERMMKLFRYDSGIHIRMRNNEDGSETIEVTFDDRFNWNDDIVSGRIPLDKDSLLLDWITRLNDAGHRYGWEFDYEIAKDIEHPIDGGANNDYLARLTLTRKCDKEEDDWLFENSSESGKMFNEGVNGFDAIEIELNPQPQGWDYKVHDEVAKKLTRKIARELGYRFRSVTNRDNANYIAIEFTSQFHIIQKAQEIVKKVKDMYPKQLVFSGISPLKRGKFEITFEVNKKYVFDLVESKTAMESTKKFAKEGTESNPRFKCMEDYDYSGDIVEFREDVIYALKKCYDDEYIVKPDMMDDKCILISDPQVGLEYKIDISVPTEVDQ